MKITNLIVPLVALSAINNPNYQVQAARVEWQMPVNQISQCVQGCVATQALGAKACSLTTPYFPPAYAACMALVSGLFTACCIDCGSRG